MAQPVVHTQACASTPDLLNLYRAFPARYPFLMQSVATGPLGRYDLLLACPQETLPCLPQEGSLEFLQSFAARWKKRPKIALNDSQIPFVGGFFAYFAYDYAQIVEPVLNLPQGNLPMAQLTHCPAAVIYDHLTCQLHFVAEPDYADCIEQMRADWAVVQQQEALELTLPDFDLHEDDPEAFLAGVAQIKDYILAGDVFQVNLSRAWQVSFSQSVAPEVLYARLRRSNPAPFAALADFGAWQIISSSPERLVRQYNGWLETRPIAGTRRRDADVHKDAALKAELLATVKERAEHIMLIDLERNDLGRICMPGSVDVNELMVIESYAHVHHIVSNVRGRPQPHLTPLDVVHALFPGGTITGCPKIRCMEIIAQLEEVPRLAYTGSLGYISWDGRMDLNILIRTLMHQGQEATFRAGAGIVADAQAQQELAETRHKAEGLLRALK